MDGIGWNGTGAQERPVRTIAHLHRGCVGLTIPMTRWHIEGEQSEEGFLLDQGENVRHPRIRAKSGLGQNEICLS